MLQRFNIIIIWSNPGTADHLAQKETGRPGGLEGSKPRKVQGNSQPMFSRQRCRKCRRGAASHLILSPFPSPLLMPPMLLTLIALLLMLLLMFLAFPSSPLMLLMSFTKKPLQKLRSSNDRLCHCEDIDFWRFLHRQEAMHVHGTSSVSHPGSFLKTVGGMRVDSELVSYMRGNACTMAHLLSATQVHS